jgi:uracil-DNA glycosylase family 4
MASPHREFLSSLQAVLVYHRVIGIEHYPAGEGSAHFLKAGIAFSPSSGRGGELPKSGNEVAFLAPDSGGGTVGDIAGEICACTGCVLHTRRLAALPGLGSEKPRLLIIGSWLTGQESIPQGCILGIDEDAMLSRMLSAIHLPRDKAYVTNIIKCSLPEACQPSDDNIQVCSAYLIRQIDILRPEVICTMGIAATRALLKGSLPLSQLRGKVHSFSTTHLQNIPLVPTYHPTFLLQNPDFKRATWEDLQNIGRLLKGGL